MSNDVDLDLWISGAWSAVPLYAAAGTVITRGHEPLGSWPRPTRVECEINNDTLTYDPARPESPLYGLAGRNTKARLTVNTNVRVWAEASSWEPDRSQEHASGVRGRAWCALTAEGILRRIGMWTDPLRSPMYRTIVARSTSIGHWPLEDEQDSLSLANTVSRGRPGSIKGGAVLGESEAPLGAQQTAKVAASSQLAGTFLSASNTAGWQVCWSFRLAALPGSATYQNIFRWSTSVGYYYAVQVNNASYNFVVTDSTGAVLHSSNVLFGTGAEPNQWITFRMKCSQSGGNVLMEAAWYPQNSAVLYGISPTFAGTVGRLVQWWQEGNAYVTDAHYGHVFGVTGIADNLLTAAATTAINGFLGERAGDRFSRLCGELGVPAYFVGTAADTQKMGPQRADTFLNLLKQIRDTDDCRIDDERFDIGLTMRTRRALYSQNPALVLSYPIQVAVPFRRVLDDAATRNRVTVKNASGGEVTAELLAGSMSVQPPPAGVGEYKQTVDVSVANAPNQLPDLASWHLAKGTLEQPRYLEVTADLLANPALVTDAMAVREGDYIRVDDAEPDPVRLLVVGIVERVGAVTWTITYQTEPYEPYRVGVYDTTTWRWDTATTALAEDLTPGETIWDITTSDPRDVLTTAAGSIPFDVMVGGERCTVTSVTAAAGTGPYTQQIVCTRSINGVVKNHATGEQIVIYESRRWGF